MSRRCGFVAQEPREPSPSPLRGKHPEHLQQFKARGLPPVGEHVEFDNTEAFPPKLKRLDVDPSFRPEIKPGPRPPVQETRRKMRELALSNPRVREALGERFALLGSGWLELEKDKTDDVTRDRYRLVFYSYGRNRAFNVDMAGNEVVDFTAAPIGYQPPASHEEVQAAADVVRRDDRFRGVVDQLSVRGIETPSKDGNRHLYLTFYEQNRKRALFQARVDMTSGRVVDARRVRP